MQINDVFQVINSEKAAAFCLSKGGWEGWLQCELWGYLSLEKKQEVERELAYPRSKKRCDLVVRQSNGSDLWVELKAYGVFREGDGDRFLDAIAADVHKISNERPSGTNGLVLVVVPKAIAQSFATALAERRWNGFASQNGQYAVVYYMNLSA